MHPWRSTIFSVSNNFDGGRGGILDLVLVHKPIVGADVLSPTSRTPHSARSDAFSPFASVQLDAGANTGAVPQTWEGICKWVLGRRVDLWETAFEPVFLQVSATTHTCGAVFCSDLSESGLGLQLPS